MITKSLICGSCGIHWFKYSQNTHQKSDAKQTGQMSIQAIRGMTSITIWTEKNGSRSSDAAQETTDREITWYNKLKKTHKWWVRLWHDSPKSAARLPLVHAAKKAHMAITDSSPDQTVYRCRLREADWCLLRRHPKYRLRMFRRRQRKSEYTNTFLYRDTPVKQQINVNVWKPVLATTPAYGIHLYG